MQFQWPYPKVQLFGLLFLYPILYSIAPFQGLVTTLIFSYFFLLPCKSAFQLPSFLLRGLTPTPCFLYYTAIHLFCVQILPANGGLQLLAIVCSVGDCLLETSRAVRWLSQCKACLAGMRTGVLFHNPFVQCQVRW